MKSRWWPALLLAGIWIVIAGVVLVGVLHHAPRTTAIASGSPRLFLSPSGSGRASVPGTALTGPNRFGRKRPAAAAAGQSAFKRVAPGSSLHASLTDTETGGRGAALIARFPVVAHQVLVSVQGSGSELIYFARLSNLLNGTSMPASAQQIPATADHLARAQAALDRGNIPGAVAEVRAISGPAAAIIRPWLMQADAIYHRPAARAQVHLRVAQNTASPRVSRMALPSEIPPYARESTGPGGQ